MGLIFKSIPDNGFNMDGQSGANVSNPTPQRRSSQASEVPMNVGTSLRNEGGESNSQNEAFQNNNVLEDQYSRETVPLPRGIARKLNNEVNDLNQISTPVIKQIPNGGNINYMNSSGQVTNPSPTRRPINTNPPAQYPPNVTNPSPTRRPINTNPPAQYPPNVTNPSPTRRPINTNPPAQYPPNVTNPSPTRRPINTNPLAQYPSNVTNPSPTRRPINTNPPAQYPPNTSNSSPAGINANNTDYSGGEDVNRTYSNPTPRRRNSSGVNNAPFQNNNSAYMGNSVSAEQRISSAATRRGKSVDGGAPSIFKKVFQPSDNSNVYINNNLVDRSLSNPTPSRRSVAGSPPPQNIDYSAGGDAFDDRASNPTPRRRSVGYNEVPAAPSAAAASFNIRSYSTENINSEQLQPVSYEAPNTFESPVYNRVSNPSPITRRNPAGFNQSDLYSKTTAVNSPQLDGRSFSNERVRQNPAQSPENNSAPKVPSKNPEDDLPTQPSWWSAAPKNRSNTPSVPQQAPQTQNNQNGSGCGSLPMNNSFGRSNSSDYQSQDYSSFSSGVTDDRASNPTPRRR